MSVPKRQASAARSAGGGAAQEWTTAEVLAWLAEQGRVITPATWYSYVSRGQAPAPVRYIARTPVWDPAAVRRFQAETRRGRAVPDEAGAVTGDRMPVGHPVPPTLPGQCPAPAGTGRRAVPEGQRGPVAGSDRPGGAGRSGSDVGRAAVRVRVMGDLYHGRVPDGAVYIGRAVPGLPASQWANRHRVGQCRACGEEHDQADAVAAYAQELAERPELVAAARRDLAGVDLACWCRVGAGPCHGDVLVRVVAGGEPGGADAAGAARDLRLW